MLSSTSASPAHGTFSPGIEKQITRLLRPEGGVGAELLVVCAEVVFAAWDCLLVPTPEHVLHTLVSTHEARQIKVSSSVTLCYASVINLDFS